MTKCCEERKLKIIYQSKGQSERMMGKYRQCGALQFGKFTKINTNSEIKYEMLNSKSVRVNIIRQILM